MKKSCESIGYSLPSVEDTAKFSIPHNISEGLEVSDRTEDGFTKVEGDCLREADGCKIHIETDFDSETLTWAQKSGEKINDTLWLRTKVGVWFTAEFWNILNFDKPKKENLAAVSNTK